MQKTKTLLRVRAFPNKDGAASEHSDLTIAAGSSVQKTMHEDQPAPGAMHLTQGTGKIKGAPDLGMLTV